MGGMKTTRFLWAVLLALVISQCWAGVFDKDIDYDEIPWAEIEVQLPAFPEKENLIPFQVGVVVDTQYLIDGNSISVGSDEVVRYTLVVISSEGAQTISYEGMRCATRERKFYAFGRTDKTWSRPRSNQWFRVQGTTNNPHVELFANNFCANGLVSVSGAEHARGILLKGGVPRP